MTVTATLLRIDDSQPTADPKTRGEGLLPTGGLHNLQTSLITQTCCDTDDGKEQQTKSENSCPQGEQLY